MNLLLQSFRTVIRKNKYLLMPLFDILVVLFSLFLSFLLVFENIPKSEYLIALSVLVILIALPIFHALRLYVVVTKFISLGSLEAIIKATSMYAILFGLGLFFFNSDYFSYKVILVNWVIVSFVLIVSRVVAKSIFINTASDRKKNVLIYGAGNAGMQLMTALNYSLEYRPVGFIDDFVKLQGSLVGNLKVYSSDSLESIVGNLRVHEILIAIPSLSLANKREIIEALRPLPVNVRSLPSVSDLAQGKVRINDLHEISIKDLLGRDSVEPINDLLKVKITDKVAMVTGAGGSIGSELCRQILFLKPKQLILFEVNEFSLYQVDQELDRIGMPHVEILPILGSVRDRERLEKICKHFGVQTIYHAAAYKHVPLVEFNNSEGVLNNSVATRIVAEVAIASKVETFVLISTDKAVRPTNTMGATKRVAELVLQAFAAQGHSTCFSMVRFGNVLDSSGSVIPLFKQQIKEGGPVTVTDENIVRYFMTIPEAVELVIQAGAMCKGGDVFVLDMGEPVRIYDLAKRMIQLSGLQVWDENNPDGDIEIKSTGLRPGEKLYEELLVGDNTSKTDNPLIMRAEEVKLDWATLRPILDRLQEAAASSNQERIRELLIEAVPEFKPQCEIVDFLFDDAG